MKSSLLFSCFVVFCVFPGGFCGIIGFIGEVLTGSTTAKPLSSLTEGNTPKPFSELVNRIENARDKIRTEAEKRVQALLNRTLSNGKDKPESETTPVEKEDSMPNMSNEEESTTIEQEKLVSSSIQELPSNKDKPESVEEKDGQMTEKSTNEGEKYSGETTVKQEMPDESMTIKYTEKTTEENDLDKILGEIFSDAKSLTTSEASNPLDGGHSDNISSSPKVEESEVTQEALKPTQSITEASNTGNDSGSTPKTGRSTEEGTKKHHDLEIGPFKSVLSGLIDVFNPKSNEKN